LHKYGLVAVATATLVAAATYAAARATAPVPVLADYESTATIVFARSTEHALAEAFVPGYEAATIGAEGYASAIASPSSLSEVSALTGLPLNELRSGLHVTTSAGGTIIVVSFRHGDAAIAEGVATSVAAHFVDSHRRARFAWSAEYDALARRTDPRTVLETPPPASAIHGDPLYVADVSPASPIYSVGRPPVSVRHAYLAFIAVLAGSIAVAYGLTSLAPVVLEDGDVARASGADRLGFAVAARGYSRDSQAARRRENAAAVASDLERRLIQVGKNAAVFTSPQRSEGKSSTVRDVALFLAAAGRRTVLVETDFLGDELASTFGLGCDHPGLAEYLRGESERPTLLSVPFQDRLWLLPRGTRASDSRHLLASDRLRWLAARLSQEFDVVLYDSPSALAVHDAASLASLAGASVVVVREGVTRMEAIGPAVRGLAMAGAPVLGFVYFSTPASWERPLAMVGSMAVGISEFRRQFRLARLTPATAHFLVALFRFR
jgi:Mrp family chromosome partitioning ATPase